MVDAPQSSRRKSHKVALKAAEPLLSLLPISILTDSYKTTHYLQYPESSKMVAVRVCVAILFSENASHKIQLSSTQNSAMGMTRIQMIQGLFSMAYDTCWKLSLPDSGPSKTLTRQLLSSGMHVPESTWLTIYCFFATLLTRLSLPACNVICAHLQLKFIMWPCSTHMAPGYSNFPFPKDLMLKVVQQNNGKPYEGICPASNTCLVLYVMITIQMSSSFCMTAASAALQAISLLFWRLCLKGLVSTPTAQCFRWGCNLGN